MHSFPIGINLGLDYSTCCTLSDWLRATTLGYISMFRGPSIIDALNQAIKGLVCRLFAASKVALTQTLISSDRIDICVLSTNITAILAVFFILEYEITPQVFILQSVKTSSFM